jgi:hypothetical protein
VIYWNSAQQRVTQPLDHCTSLAIIHTLHIEEIRHALDPLMRTRALVGGYVLPMAAALIYPTTAGTSRVRAALKHSLHERKGRNMNAPSMPVRP